MAKRSNHYDAAFEEFLRGSRVPHVVVDETRRALMARTSLKSMDFIVYSQGEHNLLVDVKGRQFPSGRESGGHKWENWSSEDDVDSLLRWQEVFGTGFRSLLVFAYNVVDGKYLRELETPFTFRNRLYAFYGVWADEYRCSMKTRSPSWETVSLPSRQFRELRLPIREFL